MIIPALRSSLALIARGRHQNLFYTNRIRRGVYFFSGAKIRSLQLDTMSKEDDDDPFGPYDIILPPEPLIDGVFHIPVRAVPSHILRPLYVEKKEDDPLEVEGPYIGDGRIELGGDDERKLRKAADLAKKLLLQTRGWIKVCRIVKPIPTQTHSLRSSQA